jgi:DnaJ-domain-containing protein 1
MNTTSRDERGAEAGMEGQVQGSGFSTTDPSRFANDLQSLLGADAEPDSIFLEESWTLGVSTAAENLRKRRRGKADRERQSLSFRELNNLGSIFLMQESEWSTESLLSERTSAIAGQYAGWSEVSFTEECAAEIVHPMSGEQACQVLGVDTGSSREQIKIAYRRMVGQWHPDRHECSGEAVRRRATEKMAAINEAYRLLCTSLMQEAA